jgi:hypothetical protein
MDLHFGENIAEENTRKHTIVNRLPFKVPAASFACIFAVIVSFTVK